LAEAEAEEVGNEWNGMGWNGKYPSALYEVNKVIKSDFSLFCASKFCINISCTLIFIFILTVQSIYLPSNLINSTQERISRPNTG
jgi:hypothetical protein